MDNHKNAAQILTFTPITLAHKERVEAIRRASGNLLYMYTFPSLFAWKEDERYKICLTDDAFLIKEGAEGQETYFFPCGSDEGKRALIDALLELETPCFTSMTDEDKAFLEAQYPGRFTFEERRDEFIYLFDLEAQKALKGKDYKKLRHHIHIGETSAEEWKTEPLTQQNAGRALAVAEQWSAARAAGTATDMTAVRCALENFSALEMHGMLFQADGEDTAFIAGSFISPERFDLAYCKVLGERRDFFVRWAFYCSLPEETKILDSEEDLGIEGLRINKLSRQPMALIRIWKGIIK